MVKKELPRIRALFVFFMFLSVVIGLVFYSDSSFSYTRDVYDELPADKMDLYTYEFSTNLPIVVLQSDVSLLYDRNSPPLSAMWFFDNGEANRLTDVPTDVFSHVTLNYRGATSLDYYPKKGYKIKLYDESNSFIDPLNYSFFELEPSSEWVLRSPYADKSLLRDWFAYELAAMVLEWQPQGRPVQLFLQDGKDGMIQYQGVYFFSQYIPTALRVGVDLGEFSLGSADRVDFNGGGYIFQRDRENEYSGNVALGIYRIMHPGRREITALQHKRLIDEVTFYHDFLNKRGEFEAISNDEWDYWNYIDVDSFINYFLAGEIVKNIDSGRLSVYMYRPVGGKLVMGPQWDADLSMGNAFYRGPEDHSFQVLRIPIIRNLLEDRLFAIRLVEKWQEYRTGIWSNTEVFGLFDAMVEHLTEPAAQNAERWPEKYDGVTYIWPNPEPYTASWDEEIERIRSWLFNWLEWLDEYIPMLVHMPANEINQWYYNHHLAEESNDAP